MFGVVASAVGIQRIVDVYKKKKLRNMAIAMIELTYHGSIWFSDVSIPTIMLIADMMTLSGVPSGITRTGITSEKESVLARSSFETPIKHLMNAAKVGEEDHLNSVIENVLLNQPVPLGTGIPELIAKVKKK